MVMWDPWGRRAVSLPSKSFYMTLLLVCSAQGITLSIEEQS